MVTMILMGGGCVAVCAPARLGAPGESGGRAVALLLRCPSPHCSHHRDPRAPAPPHIRNPRVWAVLFTAAEMNGPTHERTRLVRPAHTQEGLQPSHGFQA